MALKDNSRERRPQRCLQIFFAKWSDLLAPSGLDQDKDNVLENVVNRRD